MHGLAIFFGLTNASGKAYLFWSGIASDLTYLGALGLLWRKINCHAKGCWRIGLHHVSGTHFITCRHHHPHHAGKTATARDILAAHEAAQ